MAAGDVGRRQQVGVGVALQIPFIAIVADHVADRNERRRRIPRAGEQKAVPELLIGNRQQLLNRPLHFHDGRLADGSVGGCSDRPLDRAADLEQQVGNAAHGGVRGVQERLTGLKIDLMLVLELQQPLQGNRPDGGGCVVARRGQPNPGANRRLQPGNCELVPLQLRCQAKLGQQLAGAGGRDGVEAGHA